ncbi:MAG TPA: STAS domain-containing protein [Gaiellaceae bacterium]|nr:STAS domain-containing protein [Gaiellaceae bacterium]
MSPYELEVTAREDVVCASLAGELDLTNAAEVEARLRDAAPEAPLVIDLSRVTFLDSAGLHLLFRLARARGRGGLGIVVQPGATVARTLEIAGVAEAAAVGPALAEVRTALAAARPRFPSPARG